MRKTNRKSNGGVLLICNHGTSDRCILPILPDSLMTKGRGILRCAVLAIFVLNKNGPLLVIKNLSI